MGAEPPGATSDIAALLDIGRARPADVDGIVSLARANEAEQGGSLTGRRSAPAILAALDDIPSVVARERAGRIVGFVLATERQRAASAPVVAAMLSAYSGASNAYVYGPVCVDAAWRGKGVLAAMVGDLGRLVAGREGILFIKEGNVASLRAHRRLGMREVAAFTYQSASFTVLSFGG